MASYKLIIGKNIFDFTCENVDDALELSFEYISMNNPLGKKYVYNISKRLYKGLDKKLENLSNGKNLTFGNNVYLKKVKVI